MERPRSGGSYRRNADGTLEQVRAPAGQTLPERSISPVETHEPENENDDEDLDDGTV